MLHGNSRVGRSASGRLPRRGRSAGTASHSVNKLRQLNFAGPGVRRASSDSHAQLGTCAPAPGWSRVGTPTSVACTMRPWRVVLHAPGRHRQHRARRTDAAAASRGAWSFLSFKFDSWAKSPAHNSTLGTCLASPVGATHAMQPCSYLREVPRHMLCRQGPTPSAHRP